MRLVHLSELMSPPLTACKTVVFCGLAAGLLTAASAQVFEPLGGESPVNGPLRGDQVFPSLGLGPGGGYAVWQDSRIDLRGQGVGAIKLDAALQPAGEPFVISQRRVGHQEHPSVAMLTGGGAAFVWHGGDRGTRDIFARFTSADGTFLAGDIQANAPSGLVKSSHYIQVDAYKNNVLRNRRFKMSESARVYRDRNQGASVTALPDGGALVAYSGWRRLHTNWTEIVRVERWYRSRYITNDLPQKFGASQDWMLDVFFQRFSADGKKVGGEVVVNQFARYNQRNPSVAVLPNGSFVVAWVSENVVINLAPANAPLGLGNATQVDIMARLFSPSGEPLGSEFKVNSTPRSTASPAVSAMSDGRFTVVWAGRDGIRANGWDIYARVFSSGGEPQSDVLRLNTHTYGDQFGPRIGSVGANQLVVWSSLGQDKSGGRTLTRVEPDGNITTVQTSLSGSWQSVYGRLLSDGVPAADEFRVNATLGKQLHPEVSADSAGRFLATWSSFNVESGFNLYCQSYSTTPSPGATNAAAARLAVDSANGGAGGANGTGGANAGPASVAGGLPTGAVGWRVSLSGSLSKLRLNWSTEAGARYQVQTSSDLRHWTDLAAPRTGTGAGDSVGVDANGTAGFFRVIKLP